MAGTLAVTRVNGFAASVGNTFQIMTFASRSGTFSTLTGANAGNGLTFKIKYDPTDVTLTV